MSSNVTDIKELMENAKRQIEERKSKIIATQGDDRMATMVALQARIASAMGNLEMKGQITATQQLNRVQNAAERDKSLNLIIDSEGRTIDKRTGEIIQIQSREPTLKANIRAQKRDIKLKQNENLKQQQQQLQQKKPIDGSVSELDTFILGKSTSPLSLGKVEETTSSTYFDPRLKLKSNLRTKRKLTFHEKGKFEDLAKKLRDRAKLELLKQEISKISKKTGISSDSQLALIHPKRFTKDTNIPSIEWWDYAVLNELNYDCLDNLNEIDLKNKLCLSNLIEHPVQMKPPTANDKKLVPTVMLTAKERKKMRRQNRAEALKEEQEKIRLGLIAPPEPKVKISNLMRVLGTEAVQDPTKVEEYVRNQMAKRQRMHEEQNAARKLTDEQRAEKKKRKIMENTSNCVNVSVYRVRDLSDPSTKFKIEANCNQLHMTGAVVLCKNLNVVVVEGGPKQQKKFRRLMMNRIKWSELSNKKAVTDDDDNFPKEKNSCALVWEGAVKQRSFSNIIYKYCPTSTFAREYFKKHNCEHYWDAAQSDAILESSLDI